MRQIKFFFLFVILFCQSCAAQQVEISPTLDAATVTAAVTAEETQEMPTLPVPDVLVDPLRQRGQVIAVSVGDVIAVAIPPGSSRWKVGYADSVVEALTSAENMAEPGPQGWLFRAVAVGQTDLRLTAPAAICNQPQPCPPAPPPTFVFTVEVK